MNGLQLTVVFSASSYICGKLSSYCCTEPQTHHSHFMQVVKQQGVKFRKWCDSVFGSHVVSVFSDIIVDNAWISILVIGILMNPPYHQIPIDNPLSRAIVLVGCGIIFTFTAWATRAVLTVCMPMVCEVLVNVICPRNFRGGSDDHLDGIDDVFAPNLIEPL